MQLVSNFKKVVFQNYANFQGRASRSEFWWYALMQILVVILTLVLMISCVAFDVQSWETGSSKWNVFGQPASSVAVFALVSFLFFYNLAMFLPFSAVSVRRLHDIGKSGWWYLLAVIPVVSLIGSIVLLVFCCLPSQAGENEYGANPAGE